MAPEFQILTINAVALSIAWLGLYPSIRPLTLPRLMLTDTIVTALTLITCGALFRGAGTRFWLPIGATNWFGFWLLSYLAVETLFFVTRFNRLDLDE